MMFKKTLVAVSLIASAVVGDYFNVNKRYIQRPVYSFLEVEPSAKSPKDIFSYDLVVERELDKAHLYLVNYETGERREVLEGLEYVTFNDCWDLLLSTVKPSNLRENLREGLVRFSNDVDNLKDKLKKEMRKRVR